MEALMQPVANFAALVAATVLVALLFLVAFAARHGGAASSTYRVGRALGMRQRAALRLVRFLRFDIPFPGWPAVAGGAHSLNELRQGRIDAQAAYNALLDERDGYKARVGDLLSKQAKGAITKEEEAILATAEAASTGLDSRISASRKLVANYDEQIVAAEQRNEREKVAASKERKAPVSVDAPNLAKDPAKGFRSHREFMVSVIKAGKRGSTTDERLQLLAQRDAEDEQAEGETAFLMPEAFTPRSLRGGDFKAAAGSDEQGVYDDRFGGIAVGRSTLPGVLQLGFEGDPTAGRTQPVPMATPTVDIIARTDKDHTSSVSGGFTVTRRPETVSASSSRASMEMVTLKAAGLFGLAFATEELLADSPISFVAIIEAGFRDQFAHAILAEKIRGKGGNEYLGILTALAATSLGPTISVAKEGGQLAATIVSATSSRCAPAAGATRTRYGSRTTTPIRSSRSCRSRSAWPGSSSTSRACRRTGRTCCSAGPSSTRSIRARSALRAT
jgi:HK97 family phage major capsid protein